MTQTNEANKVEAYARQFSRLALLTPGTPNFDIEKTTLDTLWESLSDSEKAVAHDKTKPYLTKILKKNPGGSK